MESKAVANSLKRGEKRGKYNIIDIIMGQIIEFYKLLNEQ